MGKLTFHVDWQVLKDLEAWLHAANCNSGARIGYDEETDYLYVSGLVKVRGDLLLAERFPLMSLWDYTEPERQAWRLRERREELLKNWR